MAQGINKVILVGTVGKDPEMKYMPSGDAIANLTLATNESWKDKNTGEKKESTEWHNLSIFGGLADVASKYVRKGQLLYVEGSLKTRSWEKDGQKHYSTGIVVSEMQMLGSKREGNESHERQQPPARQQPPSQQRQAPSNQGGRGGFGNGKPAF